MRAKLSRLPTEGATASASSPSVSAARYRLPFSQQQRGLTTNSRPRDARATYERQMSFPTARRMFMKTLMVPAFAAFVVLLSSGPLAAQQRPVTHGVAPNPINLSLPDLEQSGALLPRLEGSGR